ncbi:hypothetical protein, conserved [Eimeria praecox]|uniref:MI domain-containing protein n=1 Tax=Eimeria praecox TaxID=51316 RepID=U6GLZ3_9EIME|nr:hypothetical protein, conserved [Eimeria praecox]
MARSGADGASQTYGQARQHQLSRKERRKQLRAQQRQNKKEHQTLKKKQRMQREAHAVNSQQHTIGRRKDERPMEQRIPGPSEVGLTDADKEGRCIVDSKHSASGGLQERGSTEEVAEGVRKAQKQQRQDDDALQRELRILERKLGIRRSKMGCAESSRAMKKLKKELKADGFDLELQDILEGSENQARAIIPVNGGCSVLLGKTNEVGAPGDMRTGYGVYGDCESIGVAAAALKEEQKRRQHQSQDPLREELKILEKRLGISRSGSSQTKEAREKKRRKLREELEADGFDLELQDVLDDILGLGTEEAEGCEPDKSDEWDDTGGPETESDCASVGAANSEAGSACFSDVSSNAPLDFESSRPSLKTAVQQRKEKEGAAASTVCVAPHRRGEAAEGSDTDASAVALETVKIEAVRALNGVSEDNVDTVLRRLLHAIQQNAADLCRDFLASLAVCFSKHFPRALVERCEQQNAAVADTASLTTRHAVVGVCCLYDFGFVSPHLFVELIWRVSGLRNASSDVEHSMELSDFRVELLLLLLRLGGEKLRQDDATLFSSTWKELECLVQRQGSCRSKRFAVLEENRAEAGGLRALLLELQELKCGKQKGRLKLGKASQNAMRRWLCSSTLFGPNFLSTQYQIDGSWEELEHGQRPELSTKAAAAAHFQEQQQLQAGDFRSAPDALASGAAANSMRKQAALLRFNTELQQSLFKCFVTAKSPDDALQLLQNNGHMSMKKTIITQTVAVAMQCCLQEKFYNQFYGMVLSRLCGICGCQSAQNDNKAVCKCFMMREKGAARYRRTIQRGLAAQASAAHGFSIRRLLNLAKLTAYLIRLHVTDLRIVRFLNFDSAGEKQGPMGLSGKLGIFLREICVELLCCPTAAASPISASGDWKRTAVSYFQCLGSMSDIREAFITLLQDVVLPDISRNPAGSSAERALEVSVVKSAIRTLLVHQDPGI